MDATLLFAEGHVEILIIFLLIYWLDYMTVCMIWLDKTKSCMGIKTDD